MDQANRRVASAEPKQPQPQPSIASLRRKAEHLRRNLEPASPPEMAAELARCLTLCAPSGMTQDDRAEWIAMAILETRDMPADLFRDACAQARRTCDHPAKIIPAICRYEPENWPTAARRRALSDTLAEIQNAQAPRLTATATEQEIGEDEREEVKRMMAGLVADMKRATAASERAL